MRRQILFSVDENWPFLTTATCVGIVWLLVESMGRGRGGGGGGRGGNWVPLERSFLSSGLWSIQALHFLVFSDCYYSRGLHKYEAAPLILVYT